MNMPDAPQVSVIMAVHNGERYLRAAIDSVLSQSFTDFELIVVDDVSTDATPSILDAYADERMRRLRTECNLRAAGARNYGISVARGRYLAIQDADDVSYPGRLAAQVDALEADSQVGVLGSAYAVIDGNGAVLRSVQAPMTDTEVRWRALFGNPFCQSTIMLRREVIPGGQPLYDESPGVANVFVEDYDAWTRLLRVTKGANLADELVAYRAHEANMSLAHGRGMEQRARLISKQEIERVATHWALADAEVAALRRCHRCKGLLSDDFKTCARMFDLFDAFCGVEQVDPQIVARVEREWMESFIAALPVPYWAEFVTSGLLRAFLERERSVTVASLGKLGTARVSKKMKRWHG